MTRSARCTPPSNTTSTPSPRADGAAAVRTASCRFAGPSAPGAFAGRIAPVSTSGASRSQYRFSRNADSSSVSVPCVRTTPRAPASTAARARSSTAPRCAGVTEEEETLAISSCARSTPSTSPAMSAAPAASEGTAP